MTELEKELEKEMEVEFLNKVEEDLNSQLSKEKDILHSILENSSNMQDSDLLKQSQKIDEIIVKLMKLKLKGD